VEGSTKKHARSGLGRKDGVGSAHSQSQSKPTLGEFGHNFRASPVLVQFWPNAHVFRTSVCVLDMVFISCGVLQKCLKIQCQSLVVSRWMDLGDRRLSDKH